MLIVDRIEGKYAIVESENGSIDIELSLIKPTPKEGDVLKKTKDGYSVDKAKTKERKQELFDLQSDLFS